MQKLQTVNAETLLYEPLEKPSFVVDSLIPTGKETQKMQEYTQEQIDHAEHMEIEIPADVKEQIFEYANLIGEEEKVRTLVRNLTDAINQADEDKVEELLDDAKMDIQDLPDPTIGKLELRDYGYTADRKSTRLNSSHRT